MIPQVVHWYSGTGTDHQYWFPEFKPHSNAGDCGFDAPVWQFIKFLINLWCRFCLLLYIFYAEEVERLFFVPPLELPEQLHNDKAVNRRFQQVRTYRNSKLTDLLKPAQNRGDHGTQLPLLSKLLVARTPPLLLQYNPFLNFPAPFLLLVVVAALSRCLDQGARNQGLS